MAMKVKYDKPNDILVLRWNRPENASTLQFSTWFAIQVDTDTGMPSWIQISGFKNLVAKLTVATKNMKGTPIQPEDYSVTRNAERDELWIKTKTKEPLVQRQISERIIGWFAQDQMLKEICIPDYSKHWEEIISPMCESFVNEVETYFEKDKHQTAIRRTPAWELFSQMNFKKAKREVMMA